MKLENMREKASWLFYMLLGLMAAIIHRAITLYLERPTEISELVAIPRNQTAELWLVFIPFFLIQFGFMAMVALLAYNFMKKETPFTVNNVRLLNATGTYLVVSPIVQSACLKIYNRFFAAALIDGTKDLVNTKVGVISLICGVFLFFVAAIFKYGISLQKKVDEKV